MAVSSTSIYKKDLNLKGDITVSLNEDERMIICEALAKAAPQEADIVPLMQLSNKMITGK